MKTRGKTAENARTLSISSRGIADLMEAVVAHGAPFRFRASGKSMSPAICDNDVVTISPRRPDEPHAGQVVACRLAGSNHLVVHRVVRRRKGRALVKGDRVAAADGWVPNQELLGVVTAVERDGRQCFWPWKKSTGRLAFLALTRLQVTRLLRAMLRRVRRLSA